MRVLRIFNPDNIDLKAASKREHDAYRKYVKNKNYNMKQTTKKIIQALTYLANKEKEKVMDNMKALLQN